MSQRLGDLLIAEKQLSPNQLEAAIEAQCLYGGRLGTSLIELGFLSEIEIARTLSRKLRLPYIEPKLLMQIPPEVIDLVPQKLACKHFVIPCRLDKKRLYLAMSDPTNLTIIDALAFRLGFIIVPVVVPEIRLMLALQKYYQLELSLRFQTLSQNLINGRLKKTAPPAAVAAPLTKTLQAAPSVNEEIIEVADEDILAEEDHWPLLGEEESLDKLSDLEYQKLVNLPNHLQAPIQKDEGASANVMQSTPEVEKLRAVDQHPFVLYCKRLNAAEDREDIANAIIDFTEPQQGGVGLLMIKDGVAIGWKGSFNGEPVKDFDQLQIPLEDPSILRTVAETKAPYSGPLPKEVNNILLTTRFSLKPPKSVLLMPLLLRGRLVTLLYLQGAQEILQSQLPEYQKLIDKAAMAFEMLILKNKINMR
jgi:hypothetical protein